MTSLDAAMKMLLTAQNVIKEQEVKIKSLQNKNWKMRCKINYLQEKLTKNSNLNPEDPLLKLKMEDVSCQSIHNQVVCDSLFPAAKMERSDKIIFFKQENFAQEENLIDNQEIPYENSNVCIDNVTDLQNMNEVVLPNEQSNEDVDFQTNEGVDQQSPNSFFVSLDDSSNLTNIDFEILQNDCMTIVKDSTSFERENSEDFFDERHVFNKNECVTVDSNHKIDQDSRNNQIFSNDNKTDGNVNDFLESKDQLRNDDDDDKMKSKCVIYPDVSYEVAKSCKRIKAWTTCSLKKKKTNIKNPLGVKKRDKSVGKSALDMCSFVSSTEQDCDFIMNVPSVFSDGNEIIEEVINFVNQDGEELQSNQRDHADELIKIVEQNQLKFYATDDKDTFVISLNGDMDSDRLKKLLKDGVLSIHFDDSDKSLNENVTFEEEASTFDISKVDSIFSLQTSSTAESDRDWDLLSDLILRKTKDPVLSYIDFPININRDNLYENFKKPIEMITVNLSSIESGNNSTVSNKDGSKKKKQYVCKKCNKILANKDNYLSHRGCHNKKLKKHICTECDEHFSWKSSLVRHIASKHRPAISCSLCPAVYSDQSKIRQHIKRTHLKEKKHHCTYPDCDRKFFKKYNLTLHIRTHTNERPNACSVCGASFKHISHKTRHERTHFTPIPQHGQKLLRCTATEDAAQ